MSVLSIARRERRCRWMPDPDFRSIGR